MVCLTQDSLERVRIRRIKIDWEGKNRGTGYLFMEAEKFHSAICKLENQESMAEHKSKGSEKPMMWRPADDQSLGVLGWMLYPNAEFQCFFCSVLPTCHFPSIEGWSSVTYFINSHANLFSDILRDAVLCQYWEVGSRVLLLLIGILFCLVTGVSYCSPGYPGIY